MSENGSPSKAAFVAPIAAPGVALSLLRHEELGTVFELFSDARLYEIVAGMGQTPDREYLQHCVFTTHDVTLWWVTPELNHEPCGLAVFSTYTTLKRVGVYLWDDFYGDLPLWEKVTAALVEHVFTHVTDTLRVFVHLPLPVPEDFHNALMLQGFSPWDTTYLMRPPERSAYGLERSVFDLYRQDVEDDDADLSS